MEWNEGAVKVKRSYDSTRRQQQAAQTRQSVIEAAQRLFLGGGYAATTIASIAAAAGVSAETIYKGFGGKAGLVRAIHANALAGDGPVPAEQRSDDMSARETDPRMIIRNWGVLTAEVAPRVAPILLLVRAAAATDPEVSVLYDDLDAARLARMADNARHLIDAAPLRDEVTVDDARDVLFTYSSPELYDLLVARRRWSLDKYSQFVADAMIAALLPGTDDRQAG